MARIEQEIVVKVVGGKDVGALEKQIKALEKQKAKLVVDVDVNDDEARKQLDAIDAQIADLRGEKAELVVTAKVDRALSALDEVAAEAKKAEAAAEALSVALGPELAGKADLDSIIGDFNRMGLSMDDITANADKLGAKLREVGQKDVGGRITTGFRTAGAELRSAGGSASVFANAIGNSVQDLGQVAGLSGTAGVAIGQMGEYMADAKASGEGLRTVLANFAKVAGPIAVLVTAVQIVNAVMVAHKEAAEEAAAATDQLGKAMDSAANPALGLAADMQPIVDRLHEFDTMDPGFWTDFTRGVGAFAGSLPGVGSALSAAGVDIDDLAGSVSDIIPTLEQAGIDAFDLGQAISGQSTQWSHDLLAAFNAGIISAEEYSAAFQGVNAEMDAAARAAENAGFFRVSLEQLQALNTELAHAEAPLDFFTDKWKILMDDLADGTIDTEAAADAVRFLVENLHLDPGEVRTIALDEVKRKVDEVAEAQRKAAEEAAKWAKAQQDAANDAVVALGDAQIAVNDMASGFNVMARNEDAISKAFAIGDAPLEALERVTDINDALHDLVEFIDDPKGLKGKIPDIFNPNDVNAGPFLDKLRSLRGPIEQAVSDAFATGGPAKAKATADAYVEQIRKSLHGKLTTQEVANLVGLGDMEATLKIAVDQSSLATAKQMLEILTGLQGGETPWTATVELALAAGTITPDAVKLLVAARLKDLGVDVPLELAEPTQGSKTAAKAAADRFAADNPVDMQTAVADPSLRALIEARNAGQGLADKVAPIVIPSTVGAPSGSLFDRFFHDGGGTAGAIGGVAGERGPEILDGRYLATGPTYVPPGTRVTSRPRTAVILRQRGGRGLRRFDSGGTVPSGPITVNFNGVGAIGNRYDLMRTVSRATLDKVRLRGTRA